MTTTARRPAVPGIALDSRFPTQTLIELPFPAKLDTINALITSYLDEERKPATAIFVLDLSGSMSGDRLDNLKTAMENLTGLDTSLTGGFASFHAREEVTIITFASKVEDDRNFTIDDTDPNGPDMTAIRSYVDSLETYDNTAIYTGLEEAYSDVAKAQATDPNRLYSIVLMTDGENNAGVSPDQFARDYTALPAPVQAVHVYPVLFGDGSKDAMTSIATETGGTLFDATTSSLEAIFKQIRGYQ
jgi:Ca-activated chloride channel family protein